MHMDVRQTPRVLQVLMSTPGEYIFLISHSLKCLKHTMLHRNNFKFTAELDQGSFDSLSTYSLNLTAALPFSSLLSRCSQLLWKP